MFKFTHTEEDIVDFDGICGDSLMLKAYIMLILKFIGTKFSQNVRAREPDEDHKRDIGTEMQQTMMYKPKFKIL